MNRDPLTILKEHQDEMRQEAVLYAKQRYTTAPKDAAKEGKPRPSLLPMDILIDFICPAYEEGDIKYERESHRRGFPVTDLIDALDRHKKAFVAGEDYDPETKEKYGIDKHHVAAMVFCCLSLLHTLKYHPHLDDRRDPANGMLLNEQGDAEAEKVEGAELW